MEDFIKVMSLEEALKLNGETLENFMWRTERDTDGEKAGKELEAIAKAINGGKHMDHKDSQVWKYYPVFTAVGSDDGFSYLCYAIVCLISDVCARLCVISKEAAEFFGKQHLAIWDMYINGKQRR